MSRKKRNKYYYKEKAVIRLKKEGNEITDAIRNQSLIELEEPIHHGYHAEWILRADIARREDAHVYQEALDACKGKIWSKNPEFRFKNHKTKRWEISYPELKRINKAIYDALSASAKKFFFETHDSTKYWRYGYKDKEYRCTLSYELVVLKSKSYITHRREHDNILYQMDADNDKMLRVVTNGVPYPGSYYNKFYRKHENKKEKLKAEREIVEVVKTYKGITDKKELLDL
jgi:hypothetical protein